jgi:hypothetical protein
MKGHLITAVVLLLGVAAYVVDMTGVGLALFFIAATIEIVLWLHAVQTPRRMSARLLARIDPHR